MFKEEHGAGDWGTDKLTTKYLKDTPGQEDAIVKSKKVVLKKKAVEEEKPQPDNKGYAERQAAAKKAKQDKMDRMVRARLAGDRAGKPRKNRGAFWRQEKSVGEDVEVVESDKAEYNKLMDKYGDMPMSKVPMKARLRIRELGRSVRGDKGGPTAGDLVNNMKRRRMGEDVEVEAEAYKHGSLTAHRRTGKKFRDKDGDRRKGPNFRPLSDKEKDERIAHVKQELKLKRARDAERAKKKAKPRNEEVEQVDEKTDKVRDFVKQDKSGYHRKHQQKLDKIMKRGGSKIGDMIDKATIKRAETKKPQSKVSQFILGKKEGSPFWDKVKQTDSDEAKDRRDARRGVSRNRQAERQLRSKKQRNEDVEVAEAGMIGRTKPSRELNVQKDEKPHLAGVKSLKYQKRAAHKAERKKGKQDVKINPELDETVERAKRGVDMAKQRVLAAKQRVARAKARDLGQKRRDMRNEDSEIEEGGLARSTDVDRSVERGTTGQNLQQKTLRKRAVERAARAGRTQSRESEAVKRQRRRLKRKAGLRKPTTLNR